MIKAGIFDLDGTLAYTLDSMAYIANEVMKKLGLRPLPLDNFRYYCGEGADMLVRRALKDAGDPELFIMKKHGKCTERGLTKTHCIR